MGSSTSHIGGGDGERCEVDDVRRERDAGELGVCGRRDPAGGSGA